MSPSPSSFIFAIDHLTLLSRCRSIASWKVPDVHYRVDQRRLGREQEMKFGTQFTAQGVRFRLWAPEANIVSLRLHHRRRLTPMCSSQRGWFECEVTDAGPGDRYTFVLEDGTEVPDPASRFQPEDVDGPSEVVDPTAFAWTDQGWRGRPWHEAVLYELHVGTFTPEGTFCAIIDKLDYLVSLGITAIELMPVADFPGRWNWGYDGAMLFAPDSAYGRPEDLKALVDAAHARGLMVILDVVYNHFGPRGNYLATYTPLTTDKYHTPWGPAVNYDDIGSRMVRDFVLANARYWLNEFRFDGLRFDAVHEINDNGPKHLLQEIAEQIRAATDGRYIHLILEDNDNYAGWMKRREDGSEPLYTAQWSDDIHHGLHYAATGEEATYYADFAGRTDLIGRALAEGLAWQGEWMPHAQRHRGEPSAYLPPTAFISFIQNHDQVGNRPFGERLTELADPAAIRALIAIYLLSPQVPMLFMGEEWATKQPFLFFSDVGDELADAIRSSRQKDFGDSGPSRGGQPPDPMLEETFLASKLDWEQAGVHSEYVSLYRHLLAIRREKIIPRLGGTNGHKGRYELVGQQAFRVSWTLGDGAELSLLANLSAEPLQNIEIWASDHLWLEGYASGSVLEAWSVVFRLSRKVVQ